MGDRSEGFGRDALHLFTLTALFVAQPLLDLLGRTPEFLSIRRVEFNELLLLILFLLYALPVGFLLSEALLGFFSGHGRRWIHCIFITILIFFGLSRFGSELTFLSGRNTLIAIALCSVVLGGAYLRLQTVRLFVTFLSPAIILVPAFFLLEPNVRTAFSTHLQSVNVTAKPENPVPIMMLVFDEFPITSLLDKHLKIDQERFPNFHALAQDSYWFRNATAVSDGTELSVPAILTGRYPTKRMAPIFPNYPENIFTLLSPSYELYVTETQTELCPRNLCSKELDRDFGQHFYQLAADLSVVYLHLILPSDLRANLPNISQSWGEFWRNKPKRNFKEAADDAAKDDRPLLLKNFFSSITRREKPAFYFLHVLFPHVPWKYLPSGKVYTADYVEGLSISDKWKTDEWTTVDGFQRHLLQVQYLDSLLGQLVRQLKEKGIYDELLVIVTADHGVSFQPGDRRRAITATNYYDILPVPLFLKLPNQKRAVLDDRNIETTDILPTLSDILKLKLPWSVDGLSAFSTETQGRSKKRCYKNDRTRQKTYVEYESNVIMKSPTPGRMSQLFHPVKKGYEFYTTAPLGDLLGRNVSDFVVQESNDKLEIHEDPFLNEVNVRGAMVPAHITGKLTGNRLPSATMSLALSVNGIVHAVTKLVADQGNERHFSFLVPETVFRDGANEVEVFEISNNRRESLVLRRIRQAKGEGFELVKDAHGGEGLRSKSSVMIPIRARKMDGALDSAEVRDGRAVLTGWAADVKRKELAERVLVFANGKFIDAPQATLMRKDITKVFGPGIESSGFIFEVPLSRIGSDAEVKVRLFALSKHGYASELKYFPGYQWQP